MADNHGVSQAEITRTQEILEALRAKPVISDVLERLYRELPRDLYYHSPAHTEDVLREVVLFSVIDNLPNEQVELLAIAAAFHDAGYLISPENNEGLGAEMAREAMVRHGIWSQQQIDIVETMILDTKLVDTGSGLKQIASTELSKYLLDSDLSNFGRDDFFERGECQRRELGCDKAPFLKATFQLINNHTWQTNVARRLRQAKKEENVQVLRELVHNIEVTHEQIRSVGMNIERLGFLAKLPLLLNSSLDVRHVIRVALDHLTSRLGAQAGTVFLLDESGNELTFWALQGEQGEKLEGKKMPAGKGIVGWVIGRKEPVLVLDTKTDARFFRDIDQESQFHTKNLICVPLLVRGTHVIGALQVLNKAGDEKFSEDDLRFAEQVSSQVALAIDNARLHQTVMQRNKQLEILDKRKNEMISVIAHEFRTPLNVVLTSADILSSGLTKDPATMEKMAATLMNGVQRLTKLISEIINVSHVSAEGLPLEKTKIYVPELLQKVVSHFGPAVQQRKQDLHLKLGEGADYIEGDVGLLLVVFKNLVSNAIRFTPDNGRITLSTSKSAGLIELAVSDTGIGIEETHKALIFEKFYEVTNVLEHTSGSFEFKSCGLGLGLATVRAIVQAHGATVDVESDLGKGSTFKFRLPAV